MGVLRLGYGKNYGADLSPVPGSSSRFEYPRLTPWAAFFRRFAADTVMARAATFSAAAGTLASLAGRTNASAPKLALNSERFLDFSGDGGGDGLHL